MLRPKLAKQLKRLSLVILQEDLSIVVLLQISVEAQERIAAGSFEKIELQEGREHIHLNSTSTVEVGRCDPISIGPDFLREANQAKHIFGREYEVTKLFDIADYTLFTKFENERMSRSPTSDPAGFNLLQRSKV